KCGRAEETSAQLLVDCPKEQNYLGDPQLDSPKLRKLPLDLCCSDATRSSEHGCTTGELLAELLFGVKILTHENVAREFAAMQLKFNVFNAEMQMGLCDQISLSGGLLR
ncbi:hypothetical protein Trydic_g11998, partial [Trypoxylus dichotomus]